MCVNPRYRPARLDDHLRDAHLGNGREVEHHQGRAGRHQSVRKKRFVVLPDSAFDFLCETGTEVHTRVRISDETKTVETGALWTEESLPAETILAGIVQCDRVFQKKEDMPKITEVELLEKFAKNRLLLQIGGKATVGRGQVRCVFTSVNGGGK